MDVSENNGTPKSSILIGFFNYKPSILGVPLFLETPIFIYIWNSNDPCFDWKRPCLGGVDLQKSKSFRFQVYIRIYLPKNPIPIGHRIIGEITNSLDICRSLVRHIPAYYDPFFLTG